MGDLILADGFWDPVPFSWPVMGILLAGIAVLTVGFLIWLMLQPDEPDMSSSAEIKRATRRDREAAAQIMTSLSSEAGRSPHDQAAAPEAALPRRARRASAPSGPAGSPSAPGTSPASRTGQEPRA